MHDAVLEYEYDSGDRATTILRSVEQEVGEIDGGRSQTTISREGSTVVVSVAADDLVALRAALNTWQTLVGVAEEAVRLGEAAGH